MGGRIGRSSTGHPLACSFCMQRGQATCEPRRLIHELQQPQLHPYAQSVDHLHEARQYCQALVPQQRHVSPEFQSHVAPAFKPQVAHWQLLPHVCTPQQDEMDPSVEHMQLFVAPGLQTPCPEQPLQVPHSHELVHERDCVPQLPHPCESVSPGVHEPCPVHELQEPHSQELLQVRL